MKQHLKERVAGNATTNIAVLFIDGTRREHYQLVPQ